MTKLEIDKIIKILLEKGSDYGLKILGAITVLVIGIFVVKQLNRAFHKMLQKSKIDLSLKPFLKTIIDVVLRILLGITVLSTLGIEMTSFVAILGAAGLAVGMALSGTLQNFAGGVIILIIKPFKVGDLIDAQSSTGTVKEIQIFNTYLNTLDNKTIIIPNGILANGTIINYSREPLRRVDFTVSIAYGESVNKAQNLLMMIVNNDNRVLQTPTAPFIGVDKLSDSSIDLVLRVWVATENYWPVYFDTNLAIYNRFNEEKIQIPFPQMDVHLHQMQQKQ